MWGIAALAVLWSSLRAVRPVIAATVRLVVPAGLLALPWMLFTSQVVGGSSRMLVWPLGAKLTDPTEPVDGVFDAWQALVDRGLWEVPWVRMVALVRSIVPMELVDMPDQPARGWIGLHSIGAWGIVGLVAFPLAVVAIIKLPAAVRTRVVLVAVVAVGVNVAIEGFAESFFPQSLLPLAGLLALALARWALTWSRPWRVVLLVAVVVEFATLVWASPIFDPFGTDPWIVALFTGVAVGAQLALVALVIRSLEGPLHSEDEPLRPVSSGAGRGGG